MHITSPDNPLVKRIRKAVRKGGLTDDGFAVAEGPNLVAEALRSGIQIDRIVVAEGTVTPPTWPAADTVDGKIFSDLQDTAGNSQGVLALVRPPTSSLERILSNNIESPLLLVLDAIQDPGNLGAIARSAEAFGATGLVCMTGCVHPWNPKSLRASAGSLFRLPVVYGVSDPSGFDLYPWFGAAGIAQSTIGVVDFTQPCAIWIGNEGNGLHSKWLDRCTPVRIGTSGVESLNAAVAASIFLYEARRQRSSIL